MTEPYAPPPPPPDPPNPWAVPPSPPQAQAYGQAPYQAPGYGQPAYGQPAYGQPAYGQAPHGQPVYGQGPGQPFNPYQAPGIHGDYVGPAQAHYELAGRGVRLGAVLLDGLLYAGVVLLAAVAATFDTNVAVFFALIGVLGLAIYQWVLISNTGQSLGKQWLGIRIVKLDGSLPGFFHGVFMRVWVMGVLNLISIVALVDALMILGDDRRCLHDHLAGTRVVVAH